MQTILLIGLGKIGTQVAQTSLSEGKNVVGISRNFATLSDTLTQSPNFTHIQANASLLTHIQHFSAKITHICIIVSPEQSTPQAYQDTYLAICENIVRLSPHFSHLQRIVFVSSTSVYGQNAGEIVDFATPTQPPNSATAQILLQAEATLQQHFGNKCTIIRPSGIYGKGRLRLPNMVKNLATGQLDTPQNPLPQNTWTNRIFDTDLIQIIVNILKENQPLPLYLATDNSPVPLYDVLNFLAEEMGLTLNLPLDLPKGGKRIIHNLPKNWLKYGDFKMGYAEILENFSSQ